MILKLFPSLLALMTALVAPLLAEVRIDEEAFGKSLGGWRKKSQKAAEYPLSGSTYRTYKPEVTPTPEGGLFVSIRIDHVRGWLSSDDHANLDITVDSKGAIVSAQSTIAIQGRSISSDLIVGANESGKKLVGAEMAVQIGSDLVANLSAKLLREKVVEAGRVSFPSVLRHNYNLLFKAVRTDDATAPTAPAGDASSKEAAPPPVPEETQTPAAKPVTEGPAKEEPVKDQATPGPDKAPADPLKSGAASPIETKPPGGN